jgi:single-stranded DNA-specific DHH superfamily exonuclease
MHKLVSGKEDVERMEGLLSAEGKKVLLYHNDADGISSAALFLEFFRGFELIPRRGPELGDEFIGQLIGKDPSLLVSLDMGIEQDPNLDVLMKKLPGLRVVIIDHHIPARDMNSERAMHINPRFFGDVYISTSYIVYRILGAMGRDVLPLVWIAAIGAVGDYDLRDSRDLLEECMLRYPESLKGNPLTSRIGHAADAIQSAVTARGFRGANTVLKLLMVSEDYRDFLNSKTLKSWTREVREETRKAIRKAEKGRQEFPGGLLVYTLESEMNLGSPVATHFSEKEPGKTIIVRNHVEDGWKMSLRSQSGRVNVGKLASEATKGIGSGGGHKKAAGAMVTDWDKFLKRFLGGMEHGK